MSNTVLSPTLAAKGRPSPRFASQGWRPALIAAGFGLAAILIAHGATVAETISTWIRSPSYGFAWAVLPTMAYLLWRNRRRLAVLTPSGSALGILAATAGAALWIASDLLNIAEGRQLAVVAGICAVVLAAVGRSVFRFLAPFLCLLLFLIPTGGFLLAPLKQAAVSFAQGFAAVAGLPFRTDGYSMFVGSQRYVVIDYCAALPYVLIGLFLGLTLGLLIYRSWWKIAALSLLGGGIAVVANGLRIIGIITYDYVTGSELTLAQHAYFELPALVFNFAALFLVFLRLSPEPLPAAPPGRPVAPPDTALRSTLSVLLAAALISSAPLLSPDMPSISEEKAAGELLPAAISAWTRNDRGSDWQPRAMMTTVKTSLATYAQNDRRISVFMAQTTSRRDKVSAGAIDLIGSDMWMPASMRTLTACAADRCHDVRYSRLLLRDSKGVRHLYAVYAVGEDTVGSSFELRLRRAWRALRDDASPARVIAIATDDADGIEPVDLATVLQTLLASDRRH